MAKATPAPDHDAAAMTGANNLARGKWGARVAMATTVYHLGRQLHGQLNDWRQQRQFTVTIPEGDDLYDPVQRWILDRMPADAQRSTTARTGTRRDEVSDTVGKVVRREVGLHYDGNRRQRVMLDGHPVDVYVEQEDSGGRRIGGDFMYKPKKVVMTAPDLDGRQAIVAFLQEIAAALGGEDRQPRLAIAARWGDWQTTRDLTPRTLDSVFLPEGHLDSVMDDLRRFLASEARYARLGVPWHRGYLFHGLPGTGKSTTAAAMGTTLGLDVYTMSVADVPNNSGLVELIARVPARSMLLLEDIDRVQVVRDSDRTAGHGADDSEGQGVTLDGLLNVLDGLMTPHGLVCVMTSNRRHVIDPALIRPGRVDVDLEMGPVTPATFGPMVEYFSGLPCEEGVHYHATAPWPVVVPAAIVGACVTHLYEPAEARAACLALLDGARSNGANAPA